MAALVGELELRVDSKEFITHTHIDDGDTAQKTREKMDKFLEQQPSALLTLEDQKTIWKMLLTPSENGLKQEVVLPEGPSETASERADEEELEVPLNADPNDPTDKTTPETAAQTPVARPISLKTRLIIGVATVAVAALSAIAGYSYERTQCADLHGCVISR